MSANQNRYSDIEKAKALVALDANGGNALNASKDTGIPRTTLIGWKNGSGINSDTLSFRQKNQVSLIEILDQSIFELAGDILNEIQRGTSATLTQKATALGILVDKSQLLKGAATAINQNQNVNLNISPAQRRERLEDLKLQIAAMKAQDQQNKVDSAPAPAAIDTGQSDDE